MASQNYPGSGPRQNIVLSGALAFERSMRALTKTIRFIPTPVDIRNRVQMTAPPLNDNTQLDIPIPYSRNNPDPPEVAVDGVTRRTVHTPAVTVSTSTPAPSASISVTPSMPTALPPGVVTTSVSASAGGVVSSVPTIVPPPRVTEIPPGTSHNANDNSVLEVLDPTDTILNRNDSIASVVASQGLDAIDMLLGLAAKIIANDSNTYCRNMLTALEAYTAISFNVDERMTIAADGSNIDAFFARWPEFKDAWQNEVRIAVGNPPKDKQLKLLYGKDSTPIFFCEFGGLMYQAYTMIHDQISSFNPYTRSAYPTAADLMVIKGSDVVLIDGSLGFCWRAACDSFAVGEAIKGLKVVILTPTNISDNRIFILADWGSAPSIAWSVKQPAPVEEVLLALQLLIKVPVVRSDPSMVSRPSSILE